MANDNIYFAARPPDETAAILVSKAEDWFRSMDTSGYLLKLQTMWAAYHGASYNAFGESHQINFGGEQGELTMIIVNHMRNLAQHMLNMITSTRPSMQARAINTDYESLVQTKLANGLLDYYMRDHRLEQYLKDAVESAIVLGSGYIKMEWNATKGEEFEFNEDLNVPIYTGDIDFMNLSSFDVMFDTNREDRKHDWVLTRSWKNRFDIAAKYPELNDKILGMPTKKDLLNFSNFGMSYDDTDLIAVYEFYHKRTESMPDGRYLLYLSSDVALLDSPMPYRNLPVYAISPGYYMGTPFGYTPMFDILPLQDAYNSLYSSILSNQTAFAVQNVIMPKTADVSVAELTGGLNIIEANEKDGTIRALNLTSTPKEVFDFLAIIEKSMETISGVNAVARGNPDPSLRSGNALALVQAQTLQFLSGLQQSYVMLIEDMGTGIINVLKDHANVPRVATIVGKSNKAYLKEFTGGDLDSVNRVVVDIGNPLARTTAGRVEMSEQLLQMGLIKTAQDYLTVIDTGNLDTMTEDTTSQLMLARDENENMISGEPVVAVFTDEHVLHIKEHSVILSNPDLRFDQKLVQGVTAHIQEHINLLRTTDPDILKTLGQNPLAPAPQPGQGNQPAPQGGPPQQQGPQNNAHVPAAKMNGQVQQATGGPPVATQLAQIGGANTPLPTPSKVDPNLLSNPGLQQASMGNVKKK